jgi:hypothetical protein
MQLRKKKILARDRVGNFAAELWVGEAQALGPRDSFTTQAKVQYQVRFSVTSETIARPEFMLLFSNSNEWLG